MTPSLNFRPRREHRRANHVGKLRQRLAKAIIQAFDNEGVEVRCDPAKLAPALGRWRTDYRMDVMRWEGFIEIFRSGSWMKMGIESWDTMSACIKGFTLWQDGFHFEVSAIAEGCSPSERYVYEGD